MKIVVLYVDVDIDIDTEIGIVRFAKCQPSSREISDLEQLWIAFDIVRHKTVQCVLWTPPDEYFEALTDLESDRFLRDVKLNALQKG